jgi:23S rRNA pseudouridine1911/1915/1917 synthase
MIKIIVLSTGSRLDTYIVSQLNYTRGSVKTAIKNGDIYVNDIVIKKPAYSLNEGDKIEIKQIPDQVVQNELVAENIPLTIIHEDKDLLIINKPAGLVVHPGHGNQKGTLVNALLFYTKDLSNIGESDRPGIVHRLDKDSEGLMIIAKNNEAYTFIQDQFKKRLVEKKYYAVVKGDIKEDELDLSFPLARHERNRTKRCVVQANNLNGKEAITKIKVLKRFLTKTLVEVTPKTGRTHQIRVHLSHIKHPILGDPLYMDKPTKNNTGQLLQAFFLEFTHPKTKKRLSFEIPISSRLGVKH